MKKTFVIGIVVMVVGIISFSLGLGNGGGKPIYWDHGFDVEKGSQGQSHSRRVKQFSNIDQIKLLSTHAVVIKRGDVRKIIVRYPQKVKVAESGNTLMVHGSKPHTRWKIVLFGSGFQRINANDGRTVITVPKNAKLNSINGSSSNSVRENDNDYLQLNDITAKKISYSGTGDVSLDNVHTTGNLVLTGTGDKNISSGIFKRAQISASAGDINLKSNQFESLSARSDAGDISFNKQRIQKSFTAHSDVGDIDGKVAVNKQTKITLSTDVGDKSLFGHSNSDYGNPYTKNPVRYRFSSDVGDVTIRK
ncbi:DUF4097 family beta strand repeat-containing protein [Lentilactobacillus kisonensis]|uniref:DUF4097 domain-containing protein n=1 Tax=Lentilactobacillus kisonensis F0435 TaxID=797516 RepID=H1LDI0_9LACO|nr:DUF4097 family beta strand repeat-containing protein [Lentilactobacillus kisonensis]EHO53185.1 hypothetical protein HMPREF9104_00647 [Lentilactobacillus kisonensis F0435]